MTKKLSYGDEHNDPDWGAIFTKVENSEIEHIFVCHATISDLSKIANELSRKVMDNAWIMELDAGAKKTYRRTVAETAEILVDIFENKVHVNEKISTDFGEIMVSMGSARALEALFSHISIPLAELWKPQKRGNEGFDFHTVCPGKIVNFGEAKYSNSANPYAGKTGENKGAGGQADGFIEQEKHYRDITHLVKLVDQQALDNLVQDKFGIVLAFSINAENPLVVFANAVKAALNYQHLKKAQNIYIVGVSHGSPRD